MPLPAVPAQARLCDGMNQVQERAGPVCQCVASWCTQGKAYCSKEGAGWERVSDSPEGQCGKGCLCEKAWQPGL